MSDGPFGWSKVGTIRECIQYFAIMLLLSSLIGLSNLDPGNMQSKLWPTLARKQVKKATGCERCLQPHHVETIQ